MRQSPEPTKDMAKDTAKDTTEKPGDPDRSFNESMKSFHDALNRRGLLRRKIRVNTEAFERTELLDLCRNLETYLAAHTRRLMKNDRSATVALIDFKNTPLVVKKYNPHKWSKFLSRGIRRSKAQKSWRAAKFLAEKKIPTLTPIALIEDRFFFFKFRSYFICSYLEGINADAYFNDSLNGTEEKSAAARRIIKAIQNLHDQDIFHGDTKRTNILVAPDHIYLLDLDGISFKRFALNKKRKRIKDWQILYYTWLESSRENSDIFLNVFKESFSRDFYNRLMHYLKKYQDKKRKQDIKKGKTLP